MEKLVEIADFAQIEQAELLANLLQSEGIACYVRNEASSRIMRGFDIGARVELLESDVPRALEIMQENGYMLPDEESEESLANHTGLARYIPFLRHFSFEKQMVILIVLIGGLLALLVFLGSFLSNPKF